MLSRLTAQDGPRLDNLGAAGGDFGVAMPRAYGDMVRLTGIFIAQADIKETKHTVGSTELNILIGAATGALEGFMLGGPIGAGIGAVVGGLLGAALPKQHYYTYSDTFALLLCDRTGMNPIEGAAKMVASGKVIFNGSEPILSQTLDADGKLIQRTYGQNRYFKSLTIYGGSTAQGVDAVLAAEPTIQETAAYVFSAYVRIEALQLAQFGNSVPPLEVLTRIATGQTIAATVESIAAAANIDTMRDFASTALNDFANRGYVITGESNCWDAVKPLLPSFAVDAAEFAGQVRFYARAQAMRATIPLGDMGATAAGDNAPPLFTFDRNPDLTLPKETTLTFLDPARDYLPNTATSRRSEGDARSNITASIPLVLTAAEGASAAALMHWDAWLGRTALGFAVMDNWNPIVGQAYAIPVANVDGQQAFLPYRIQRSTRGANGVTEIEAVSDEAVTYTASVPGTSGSPPSDDDTAMPDTRIVIIDMPITADDHDDYGFYLAIAGTASYWPRGYVELSGNGGAAWAAVLDTPQGCVMGDMLAILATGPTSGLTNTLDTVSVLDVELLHDGMELASATDAALDAWANFAFVGADGQGEYLQFKTATKLAPKIWRLTDLRRGRKGTDWALGLHGADEEFVLMGGDGVVRAVYSDDEKWGVPFEARGVTLHQDPADAAIVGFTNTGEGKRPYSPVGVNGSWDGSFNLTIAWTPRSRMNGGGLGIDDQDNYEVEITSGAGRVIVATGVHSVAYSAADQTTDGITPGDTVQGRVRQLSDVNDGRWRNFELFGPISIIAMETDSAIARTVSVALGAGRADETDTAMAPGLALAVSPGRADETDTALAPGVTVGLSLGRTDETDTALALGATVKITAGRADETDTALALSVAVATDPNFANVKLLLGFEGTNGSTTFTDESGTPHTATANGNAQISTSNQKFGSGSGLFDGTGDYVAFADSADWATGSGDFTIELFWRCPTGGVTSAHFCGQWTGSAGTSANNFFFESTSLRLRVAGLAATACFEPAGWTPVAGTYYHLCAERSGSTLRVYRDGVMVGKTTGATGTCVDAAFEFRIGKGNALDLKGNVDEFRFTKGVARYASDGGFTVPTAPYPRS